MENTTEDQSACAFCPCQVQSSAKAAGRRLIRPSLVTIGFDEIGSVTNETSIERGRPFRRLAIYPYDNSKRWIDVSMKHFAACDVADLLEKIYEKRPDLRKS